MRIGDLELDNPIFTAPMAGITDRAFREMLHRMGAGLVYTEMVSDMALVYQNKATLAMLNLTGEARPIAVQLCGSDPEVMAKAAKLIAARGASLIDINMGCPAPKIVRNGEGSALLRRPELAAAIVDAVANAVSLPVTIKMRRGIEGAPLSPAQFATKMVEAGAQAVTVHGRYREAYYSGTADWQVVEEVASAVKVPVIGNGDIFTPEQGLDRLQRSGASAVMLGRGLQGNPWLVRDLVALWQGEPLPPRPTVAQTLTLAKEQLALEIQYCGELSGVRQMRKHFAWYIKGWRGAAAARNAINQSLDLSSLLQVLGDFQAEVEAQE